MKETSHPPKDQLINELRQIVEKSMEANLKCVQNGSELLRQLAEGRLDLSGMAGRTAGIINNAFKDYVRTSAAYTYELMGLGVGITEGLLGRGKTTAPNHTEPEETPIQVLDLKINVRAGSRCETNFVLRNDAPEPVTARFKYSMLVDTEGESAFDVPLQFDPPVVKLNHEGDKRKVFVRFELPMDLPTGLYYNLVFIKGMPGLTYRLLVKVEEGPRGSGSSKTQRPVPKKISVKKGTKGKQRKPSRGKKQSFPKS